MDEGVGSNANAPVDDGATGNCVLGLTANGGVDPPASPAGPIGLIIGSDAPPELFGNVGLPADGQGSSEIGDAMDAGSSGIDNAPMQQSATLYPLFYWGMREWRGDWLRRLGGQGRLRG
jgi:hypothetical protein